MRPSTKCWEIHRGVSPVIYSEHRSRIDAPEHEVLGNLQGRQPRNLQRAPLADRCARARSAGKSTDAQHRNLQGRQARNLQRAPLA